jgi:elongation factor G
VLDGAVAVFDGKEGVEAQSETVWRQATKYNVPRICFVNKMDKVGADYEFCYQTILDRLGRAGRSRRHPGRRGRQFKGIIDLIRGVGIYTTWTTRRTRATRHDRSPSPST